MDQRRFEKHFICLPIADETDMFSAQVNLLVPIGSVQKSSLELGEARNGGPRPVVEDARGIDQDVTMVLDSLVPFQVLDFNVVATLSLVPEGTDYLSISVGDRQDDCKSKSVTHSPDVRSSHTATNGTSSQSH